MIYFFIIILFLNIQGTFSYKKFSYTLHVYFTASIIFVDEDKILLMILSIFYPVRDSSEWF